MRRALRECRPDLVIPCDDGVVSQLHVIHELEPSLRSLIEYSLGPRESYPVVESRYRFLSMALELGIRVPRMRTVARAEDLAAWHADIASTAVVKVDGESGGNGVRMAHSLDESLAAWRELATPRGVATAWKRLAIDRDPLALWPRAAGIAYPKNQRAQEFIPRAPPPIPCWCAGAVNWLSLVSVVVVAADGPTGAATIVRVVPGRADEERRKTSVASRLMLSGFYGLDFIMESGTGVPYLIEMNARCTQLGHIEFAGQGCLAGVLAAVLRGEPRPEVRSPVLNDTIALFPQALGAGEPCRLHLEASFHDVPAEEPGLVDELMLKSWPQRRWAARIYHAFKPLQRAEPVLFEAST